MRRPLFLVALCLVVIAALRLQTADSESDFSRCTSQLYADTAEKAMPLCITGQVYQKDEESVYLKSVIILNSNVQLKSAENVICEIPQGENIALGTNMTVEGTFVSFSAATNPGEFDVARYYRSIGVGGKLKEAKILETKEGGWPVREALSKVKAGLSQRIYGIFPEEKAAVMEALLLGEKGSLDVNLKELYRRNGILHILSISSLHITIIGTCCYKLLRKIRFPIWIAALGGGALLVLYGAMTGFSVSAIRAIVMYLIKMLGEVIGRTYDMLIALGVVGGVMVVINPFYLQNGGFLLSFGCVLGIGILYPAFKPVVPRHIPRNRPPKNTLQRVREWLLKKEPLRLLAEAFALSFSVSLGTLPLQLSLYYEVPAYSVFLNLLIVPFVEPLILFGVVALGLPWIPLFPGVACLILDGYEFACKGFEKLPFHTWNPGCPKAWQILLYYCVLFSVAFWLNVRKRKKKKCFLGLCAGLLTMAVLLLGEDLSSENTITFLDVGQGDCIVMRTEAGENFLFDCGSLSRKNLAEFVLIPYLKYYGIRKLDGVFVSHPDTDHISGIEELLEVGAENGIEIEQFILPDIEKAAAEEQFAPLRRAVENYGQREPVRVSYISAGDCWQYGEVTFICLHPREGYPGEDANAYSQCIYVEFQEKERSFSMLLTGDVDGEGEKMLEEELISLGIKPIDVLKVSHHGSKNASGQELLKLLKPKIAVISCGKNNNYGHPHKETLQRLEKVGSTVLITPENGAITIKVEEGIEVYGFGGQN